MKMKYEVNYDLGLSLGMAIAVAISWSNYNSVVWAVIHGVLNWAYVMYYFITS